MVSSTCQNLLSRDAGKGIVVIFITTKNDLLESSLFGNKLYEKIYITWSLPLWDRVLEPRFVTTEAEISNRVNVGTKQKFENELTDVLNSVIVPTEEIHI